MTFKSISEIGRSMVEVLGVLAVMGILSVTAVNGYRVALDKNHANELLSGASLRAVSIATQLQIGRTNPSLAEYSSHDDFGYAKFSQDVQLLDDGKFKITITGVSKKLCQQMKIQANDIRAYVSTNCTSEDNNTMTLEFNRQLDHIRGQQDIGANNS